MAGDPRRPGPGVTVLAALGGLAVALVTVLNLHILVGLEQGWAASPSEVVAHSPLLAVLDVALLVAGPLGAAWAVRRLRRLRR